MEKRKTAKIEYMCCPGWKRTPTKNGCLQPDCDEDCNRHGVCTGPNKCSCSPGWTGEKCNVDINECSNNNGNCQHKCVNFEGTFKCQCNPGYILQKDGRSCEFCIKCSKEFKDLEKRLTKVEKQTTYLEDKAQSFSKQMINITMFHEQQMDFLDDSLSKYNDIQNRQFLHYHQTQHLDSPNLGLKTEQALIQQEKNHLQDENEQDYLKSSQEANTELENEGKQKHLPREMKKNEVEKKQEDMMMNKAKEFMGKSPETLEVFLKLIEKLDMLERRIISCGCNGGEEASYNYYAKK